VLAEFGVYTLQNVFVYRIDRYCVGYMCCYSEITIRQLFTIYKIMCLYSLNLRYLFFFHFRVHTVHIITLSLLMSSAILYVIAMSCILLFCKRPFLVLWLLTKLS